MYSARHPRRAMCHPSPVLGDCLGDSAREALRERNRPCIRLLGENLDVSVARAAASCSALPASVPPTPPTSCVVGVLLLGDPVARGHRVKP